MSFEISVENLKQRVTPVEIVADRSRQLLWPKQKSTGRDRGGNH
jgi:hypothetical protein